ncbi:hypothetical protein [Prochlorococcus marinus]|uniref:hypothetical protein n=1 Tax=Prochlorococcus marinus TaxID=1219 RepID=UPI000AFBF6F3|nr:hypothetical protein [Prochlorococcus marinus]
MGRAVSLKGSAGDHCFACCACEWLCLSLCTAGLKQLKNICPMAFSKPFAGKDNTRQWMTYALMASNGEEFPCGWMRLTDD